MRLKCFLMFTEWIAALLMRIVYFRIRDFPLIYPVLCDLFWFTVCSFWLALGIFFLKHAVKGLYCKMNSNNNGTVKPSERSPPRLLQEENIKVLLLFLCIRVCQYPIIWPIVSRLIIFKSIFFTASKLLNYISFWRLSFGILLVNLLIHLRMILGGWGRKYKMQKLQIDFQNRLFIPFIQQNYYSGGWQKTMNPGFARKINTPLSKTDCSAKRE